MSKGQNQILLVADFNIENLAGLINNDDHTLRLAAITAPFDQVSQVLMDKAHDSWRSKPDYALVWTSPEKISPAFARLKKFEKVSFELILEEVDQLAELLIKSAEYAKAMFVSTWTIPATEQFMGLLDLRKNTGVRRALQAMNARLTAQLDAHNN
ncbi:MAG: hypothetical protein ACREBV_08855, partial [Candidatus Zixiibacteriota bacterium]